MMVALTSLKAVDMGRVVGLRDIQKVKFTGVGGGFDGGMRR